MRAFGDYNPRITAIYFAIIIGISMFCMNPVLQCLSFLGGLLYFLYHIDYYFKCEVV